MKTAQSNNDQITGRIEFAPGMTPVIKNATVVRASPWNPCSKSKPKNGVVVLSRMVREKEPTQWRLAVWTGKRWMTELADSYIPTHWMEIPD